MKTSERQVSWKNSLRGVGLVCVAFAACAPPGSGGDDAGSPVDAGSGPIPLTGATQLFPAWFTAVGKRSDGSFVGWGSVPASFASFSSAALSLKNTTGAVEWGGGSGFLCFRRMDGAVLCGGENKYGQLGTTENNGTVTPTSTLQQVSNLSDAVSLSVGSEHSCVVTRSQTVRCWGRNLYGQLGDGSPTEVGSFVSAPGTVATLTQVAEVVANADSTCARKVDGNVWCWGSNAFGQLGLAASGSTTLPTQVEGMVTATALRAGRGGTVCARTAAGAWFCWGSNASGELGLPTSTNEVREPTVIPAFNGAVEVALGVNHSCALKADGTVVCLGLNGAGQLGDGQRSHGSTCRYGDSDKDCSAAPVTVKGLTDAVELISGFDFSCARKRNGSVVCWGFSNVVGTGTDSYEPLPILVE